MKDQMDMIQFKNYLKDQEKNKRIEETDQYQREMAKQNALTQLRQD